MQFAFVKDRFNHEGWFILVETYQELLEWYVTQPHGKDGIRDLFRKVIKEQHATTVIGGVFEHRISLGLPVGGWKEIADTLTDLLFKPKKAALENGGPLIINQQGGFCNLTKGYHSILQRINRASMDWPEVSGKVRYIKWPQGRHWYAKVGAHDVVVDGHQKWDSRALAEKAVVKFLEDKGAE